MTKRIGEHLDGRALAKAHRLEVDVVVVGSGPAGASVGRALARDGLRVAIVEAGPWATPEEMPVGTFESMARYYREMGASTTLGGAPVPYLQGRMVGGSSPINGAICWRMPRDVHGEWIERDPALADALPWERLEALTDEIEAELNVRPTEAAIAAPKNLLMARGADALGLEHRPTRRNVDGCEGLGRCLQGCPKGHKRSMDLSLIPDALSHGAVVFSSVEVEEIIERGGRAVGVRGRSSAGAALRIDAKRAVVLAASAVQTPALLLRNRIRHGPVGEHFQCHPGVSMAGHFTESIRMWEGATQGHEVTGLRREGLKFEALGFGLAVLAARLPGVGGELTSRLAEMDRWLDWGAAVRSRTEGRVRLVRGKSLVFYEPSDADVALFRRGLRVLGEMMLAAGASELAPGVKGFDATVRDAEALRRLEREGPRRAGAYTVAITHMFGTCRMGSDPGRAVVGLDFQHHAMRGLYVADSSVFPSNLGVNPQIPIMAIAARCAERIAEA